jgi:hypothetical protein
VSDLADSGGRGPGLGLVPDPEAGGATLPLGTTAALVGGYRWIEQALYELLGSWVTDVPLPGAQVLLDAQSTRHAWHAELWADRLPVLAGFDPEGLTTPPEPARTVLATLAGNGPPAGVPGWSWAPANDDGSAIGPPGALPRLAGLYRVVLPRLVVSYGRHLAAASPVADGPVIRALRLILADEVEDWHAGERLVQRLVTRPHDVAAVYTYLQQLESVAVNASVGSGLVVFPDFPPVDPRSPGR